MSSTDSTTSLPSIVLPEPHAGVADQLARVFADAGHELVLVGGIVRDLLLQQELPVDLDFATDAVPEETERLGMLAGASSSYLVGARFGTVGLVFDQGDEAAPVVVEITTYRTEQYPNASRKPDVAFGTDVIDDLSRRDFTINAMAVDPRSGRLIDPYHGQADLAMGMIRAVGDPHQRFQEDPLRILRAARFVAQLGFAIESGTAGAMAAEAASLQRISSERIWWELSRLLLGRYASHGLEALASTGVFGVVFPEIRDLPEQSPAPGAPHIEKDLWEHTKRVVDAVPARPVVRWAALLHDAAKPRTRGRSATGEITFIGHERVGAEMAERLLTRLHADRSTVAAVRTIVELHGRPEAYDASWTDSAVRRLMLDAGPYLEDLLDLAAADVTSARRERQAAARDRIAALREHIARVEAERALADLRSPLDGNELMALFDRPPGRWIADVKEHLRELVIAGELEVDDKDRATAIARDILDASSGSD